ncbi:hypothetical protein RD110_15040 [Rhodoferax koreense]|uniref:DNA polymerase n=2 Tax=Rhodoferax koreensis TaxID=1842727 RepID=A0A1P8JX58_9BURK|nr:hypothetical protein RD110_15040 [Rhodoferax koreense]
MWWIAFAPSPPPPEPAAAEASLQALSWWALQFSPRVCVQEGCVLLEVSASERLFDGRRALLERLREQAADQEVQAMAAAPTALAALGLLHGMPLPAVPDAGDGPEAPPGLRQLPLVDCPAHQLRATLDALPVFALAAARPFAPTLVRLGCATLGPLRALPRGGISRRFGAGLLRALDQAYGLAPESFDWTVLPEQFRLRLEFLGRIEVAAGLMFGAHRLLRQLKAWLLARQCGATGVVLHWEHDLQRRSEAPSGSLTVRTAEATRDTTHLARLLAEHLDRTPLAAPVVAITLEAIGVEARPDATPSLLPEDQAQGETLQQFIERLSARLGPAKVLRPEALADHRPQRSQAWHQAATSAPARNTAPAFPAALAQQPPWLLRQPMALALLDEAPLLQGPLTLLAGPERIEAGWWDGGDSQAADATARDYFLARSEHAGLVWIYRERKSSEHARQGWFLHGVYG